MTRRLRIVSVTLWALAIFGMCALLASWTTARLFRPRQTASSTPPLVGQPTVQSIDLAAPPFTLTDQHNRPLTSDDLKGKVWIADFFFTTCTGPCPLMTQKMASLVKQLPQENVHFVSFSVDPETDTPQVLNDYAKTVTTDPRWHFVTGGDNVTYNLAHALKLAARPAEGLNPILHATKFVLVGPTGKVAGYYDYNDPEHLAKLAQDAAALAK